MVVVLQYLFVRRLVASDVDPVLPGGPAEWFVAGVWLLSLVGILAAFATGNDRLGTVVVLATPVLVGVGLLRQRYAGSSDSTR